MQYTAEAVPIHLCLTVDIFGFAFVISVQTTSIENIVLAYRHLLYCCARNLHMLCSIQQAEAEHVFDVLFFSLDPVALSTM